LRTFAKKAKDYLNAKHRGVTVYAGGDDFMGFVNLKHLFEVILALRTMFNEQVSQPLIKQFQINHLHQFTFSAGILIAHYKAPLHVVLSQVRALEKTAKSVVEKNAFALATMKSTGEILQTVFRWESGQAIANMQAVSAALEKNFSTKFIHVLAQEMEIYRNSYTDDTYILAKKIIDAELRRLLTRSCEIQSGNKEETIENLHKDIMQLFSNCTKVKEVDDRIFNFINLLEILDFLKRKSSH